MNHLLTIICALFLLPSCSEIRPIKHMFDTTTNYFEGGGSSPGERYYIAGGVSFLPPDFTVLNTPTVIRNDEVRFGFYYRDYGADGDVYVTSEQGSLENPIPSKEEAFADGKNRVDGENERRAEILAGTMEDHWQAEKLKMSIRDMVNRMEVRKGDKLVRVIPNFDESEWEAIAKRSFMYHFSRNRGRVKGLPENTYKELTIKGWSCYQIDKYERLGTPVGEHAQRTGGGTEHIRDYRCYIRADFAIWVRIGMDVAPGINLDYDTILRPLLDSIDVDESLPDTHTTFSMMIDKNGGA